MARITPQELHHQRLAIAKKFKRPARCEGCVGNPSTPGFDPTRSGGFVRPRWSKTAQLWVIAITGGADEERLGKPLVGPSGWTLDTGLQLKRYPQLEVGRWNIYNCRATKLGSPLQGPHVINRTKLTVKEMRDCCSRWLFPELRAAGANPKCVLILGTDAYNFLMAHRFDVFGKAMGHRLKIIQAGIVTEGPKAGLPWQVVSYGQTYDVDKRRKHHEQTDE